VPSRGDPTDQIQDAFSVAFGAVEALHASGEIERRSGVRLERSLHTLLFLVGRHGPVRISELTRYRALDNSTISRQVAQLVERGLVDRVVDPDDRRAASVTLSEDGRHALDAVRTGWHSIVSEALGTMEPDDVERFAALFARYAVGLEATNLSSADG
jgi:DNA-binding MarR family transcriptional regulator